MKRIIIFLIRRKLGLKKGEEFRFVGQKTKDIYYFTETKLMKEMYGNVVVSGVSLNYLLSDECAIKKLA